MRFEEGQHLDTRELWAALNGALLVLFELLIIVAIIRSFGVFGSLRLLKGKGQIPLPSHFYSGDEITISILQIKGLSIGPEVLESVNYAHECAT